MTQKLHYFFLNLFVNIKKALILLHLKNRWTKSCPYFAYFRKS